MNNDKKNHRNRHHHRGNDDPFILERQGHRITRTDIDQDALWIVDRLRRNGFIVYITGGAVQNLLQGIPPKDFDIVTNARPGQIKRRFSNAFLIGRRFRVVHIHFDKGKFIEVATFRRAPDVLEKNEEDSTVRLKIDYGTPREDAFRRDISINALYYDVSSAAVIDYVQGLRDMEEKRIRIIGDPNERFLEDPVRILRVVRHSARLGFSIEKKTEDTVFSMRHLLAECSSARVFEELNKDLSLKSGPVFEALIKYGLLKYLLGPIGDEYKIGSTIAVNLIKLLKMKDSAVSDGYSFTQEESYSLLFWPFVEYRYNNEKGDMQKVFAEVLKTSLSHVTLPRKLRTGLIKILILLRHLKKALRNSHMRRQWERRPFFEEASRLCFLIETGRMPQKGESIQKLFKQRLHSQGRKNNPHG
ncbi:hypothetical protein ACFLT9_01470 [Acidobacteriota bacterium]